MRRRAAALVAALPLVALAACGGSGGSDAPSTHATVLAAASLTDAFNAEKAAFEKAHPGTQITLSFAGSQSLVAQIQQGAPADVFASADERSMDAARRETTAAPRVFARNTLAIAVAPGNPKHIASLADLARPGVAVVLAAPAVPAGHYARTALQKAGVTVAPKSLEENVRSVLTKVELGEADAGIVYASDITAAGHQVSRVTIPPAVNQTARYPIAPLSRDATGRAFLAFVLSPAGQRILTRAGFLPAS